MSEMLGIMAESGRQMYGQIERLQNKISAIRTLIARNPNSMFVRQDELEAILGPDGDPDEMG